MYFNIKSPMNFPIIDTKDIVPTPAIIPVISRLKLLLSFLYLNWMNPSAYVGTIKIIVSQMLSVKTLNRKKGKVRYPA